MKKIISLVLLTIAPIFALASGAGADRFSSGMAHSFGKPAGNAAQLKENQIVLSIYTNEKNVELARKALKKSNAKLPFKSLVTSLKV